MEPLVLNGHNSLIDVLDKVSDILSREDFNLLRIELEGIYQDAYQNDYEKVAINDALYAIICERDG